MSNTNPYAIIEKRSRRDTPVVSVQGTIDCIYAKAKIPSTDFRRESFEGEVYKSALEKLDNQDKKILKRIIRDFTNDSHCKDIGPTSAREILAKLGIWLNKVKYKG